MFGFYSDHVFVCQYSCIEMIFDFLNSNYLSYLKMTFDLMNCPLVFNLIPIDDSKNYIPKRFNRKLRR